MQKNRTYLSYFVAAIVLFVGFLQKINKQDFYHHYFRVIAEIDVRNSQSIDNLSARLITFHTQEWKAFQQSSHLFFQLPSLYIQENLSRCISATYFQLFHPQIQATWSLRLRKMLISVSLTVAKVCDRSQGFQNV